jgi:hypothetical protein
MVKIIQILQLQQMGYQLLAVDENGRVLTGTLTTAKDGRAKITWLVSEQDTR